MKNKITVGVIIMAGFFSFFGCRKKDSPYQTAEIYQGLRNQLFTVNPVSINLKSQTEDTSIWGVLMETGYPEAVATLVSIADGTVSLYFSNGGGIVGAGQYQQVRIMLEQLIQFSSDFASELTKTESFPLPRKNYVRFYFLTFNGVLTAEVEEDKLGNNQHKLSPLFYKAQDLITAIRVTQEQENKK